MKKIICILMVSFLFMGAHAQLANTKWKGTINLDTPTDAYFSFTADTLDVLNAEDNSSMETMKYSIQDSVLTVQKLYGHSQCDTATMGKYVFAVTGDQMTLKVMSDACDDRSQVIGDMKLNKE